MFAAHKVIEAKGYLEGRKTVEVTDGTDIEELEELKVAFYI